MKEKEYAVVALKDILRRALAAVALEQVGVELAGWDWEFAQMSREEQVEWLASLCIELMREYAEDPSFMKVILLKRPVEVEHG